LGGRRGGRGRVVWAAARRGPFSPPAQPRRPPLRAPSPRHPAGACSTACGGLPAHLEGAPLLQQLLPLRRAAADRDLGGGGGAGRARERGVSRRARAGARRRLQQSARFNGLQPRCHIATATSPGPTPEGKAAPARTGPPSPAGQGGRGGRGGDQPEARPCRLPSSAAGLDGCRALSPVPKARSPPQTATARSPTSPVAWPARWMACSSRPCRRWGGGQQGGTRGA
jgi:hypothetical protein